MKFIRNKQNLLLFFKAYFLSTIFAVSVFSLSAYTFSHVLKTEEVSIKEGNKDIFISFLEKEKTNSNIVGDHSAYVMYANTDPVIQKIETFLSKNKNNLTQEDLSKVERFRLERITYLMAKKYIQITRHNN